MGETLMESVELGGKIGILGGGQLARMLALAAQAMGFEVLVLAGSAQDPAAQVSREAVFGSWKDADVLARFLAQCSVVLFENEFIGTEELKVATARCMTPPPRFCPDLDAIREVQNKLRQKRLLERLGIPTSPFEAWVDHPESSDSKILEWIKRVRLKLGGALVLKWAELGYDGKGTWISPDAWTRSAEERAVSFIRSAMLKGVEVFAERKVGFRKELAIIGCHSVGGEFRAYPLVVTQQEEGICRRTFGPASAYGVPEQLEKQARESARRIAEALPLHGTFAIEFFETGEGELWVNELAPRVHNSGHATQNACATDQFENHIRGALGLALGETRAFCGAFGMLNFLGPDLPVAEGTGTPARVSVPIPFPPLTAWAQLHWYGKAELRAGRKMGHWNLTADSAAELDLRMKTLETLELNWVRSLRRN